MVENKAQNREADMPDAIWAYRNKYCHENFGRLWSDEEHVNPCVKYIRADLANKPALDAEVRKAVEYFTKPDPETNVVEIDFLDDMDFEGVKHIRTLIRAASAAQEVRGPWQLIETCPKQWDSIILVTNGGGTWPVVYRGGKYGDGFYELGHTHAGEGKINGVTHWMPLPPCNGLKLVKERKDG